MRHFKLIEGQTVVFRLKDAVCPDFADSVRAIGPDLEVQGEVVFFSDGGQQQRHYAIVDVAGIHTPLIVPVDRLEIDPAPAREQEWDSIGEASNERC